MPGGFLMAIKKLVNHYLKSPLLILSLICFILGGFTWVRTQNRSTNSPTEKEINNVLAIQITSTPVFSKPSVVISRVVTADAKPTLTKTSPTKTIIIKPTAIPNLRPTVTPVSANTITLQITEPDGNFSYTLDFQNNSNPCSILTEAKSNGKIRSLTISHYGPPLNSDYVKEINGYSDSWNFAINGTIEPSGCSNYSLDPGNSVLWKYN